MIEYSFNFLNSSKIFAAFIMLLMNLGGKYLAYEIPENIEHIFSHPWVRRLLIFSLFFFTTRDVKISILLTLIFILLFKFLLDKNSRFCILQKDNLVTKREAYSAYKTLKDYQKQLTQIKNTINKT
jgi:hypothetical protein